jgi:hypothetical protein
LQIRHPENTALRISSALRANWRGCAAGTAIELRRNQPAAWVRPGPQQENAMKTNLDTSTDHATNDFATLSGDELSGVGGGWNGNSGGRGWQQGYPTGNCGYTNSRSCCDRDPYRRGGYASSTTTLSWG